MAFAMHGYNRDAKKYGFKNDPRYVKYIVRERLSVEFEQEWRIIPHRPCTEVDYLQFYPSNDDV